jgi:hypothetical protein
MLIKKLKNLYSSLMEAGKRTKESTAGQIQGVAKIGGDFTLTKSPEYIPHRISLFEKLFQEQ